MTLKYYDFRASTLRSKPRGNWQCERAIKGGQREGGNGRLGAVFYTQTTYLPSLTTPDDESDKESRLGHT